MNTAIKMQDTQESRCDIVSSVRLQFMPSQVYMDHTVFMGLKVHKILVFLGGCVQR